MLHDFLKSMDIELLACDFHRTDSWWDFKRVNSPFSRLYLITEGEAFVTHHGREYRLTPGTVHLIPCFTFVDLKCPEKFAHYNISFISRIPGGADVLSLIKCDFQYQGGESEESCFKRLLELNPECRLQELDPYRQLKQEVQRTISGEFIGPRGGAEILETDGIMRILLAPFLRNSQTLTGKKSHENLWLQEILTYIEEHFHEDITLMTLASRISLHPTYFSDLFHKLTGVRPIAYIARKRIDKSQMLLLGSNKSIKEIAFECGFRSVSYYNRSFKKAFHISPGEFRASTER
jgi:AraC-like DNA-binding protein